MSITPIKIITNLGVLLQKLFFFFCGHDDGAVGFPHPLAPGSAQACQLGGPSSYDGGAIVKDLLFVLETNS